MEAEGKGIPSGEDQASFEVPGVVTEERGPVLVPALVAGAAAAVVGGVAWGLVVRYFEYELGIVAWGIGLLAGAAVAAAARGSRGRSLQGTAVGAALAGILLGKYLSFAWAVQAVGDEEGWSIGLFSGDMITLFRENLDIVLGPWDVLWVGLAVFSAWRMLRPEPRSPPAPSG